MKRTEDKKQQEMERQKKMEGVCSVCPASEPPAKQMMINEAVGGRLLVLFTGWRAAHKPFLPNYLSLTISTATATQFHHQFLARHLPLVPNNWASSNDSADWLSPVGSNK